jgi:hypothetical protein
VISIITFAKDIPLRAAALSFPFHPLALADDEASFKVRRFYNGDAVVRERLEQIGRVFINGYNQALTEKDPDVLASRLDLVELDLRGFAFEGAAMALALLDNLLPWNRGRLRRFLAASGQNHVYMVYVGIGWAIGRLPWLRHRLDRYVQQLDPLLQFLSIDGFGFHEGYFRWQKYIRTQSVPRRLSRYHRRVFDQGLGRSLWFVECAEPSRISCTINSFERDRHADLWSGVGLASAYTGLATDNRLHTLRTACGDYILHMAQGAAFAAKARQHAGNPSSFTDRACRIFCGTSAEGAARVVDEALDRLPTVGEKSVAFEMWRERIRKSVAEIQTHEQRLARMLVNDRSGSREGDSGCG